MSPPSRQPARKWILAAGLAAGSFALGVVAARWWGTSADAPTSSPGATTPSARELDAGGPRLMIDASGIELLPDAALRLDLPPGFDASP